MKRMQSTWKVLGIGLVTALFAFAPVACTTGGMDGPDAGDGDGDGDDDPPMCEEEADPCKRNIDCDGGAICEKDEGAGVDDWGCCKRILCVEDAHCEDNEVCDQRRGLCVPEDLCDPGNPAAKCQPGEFCIYQDGLPACVAEGDLPQPDSCTISPDPIYIRAGESVTLSAVGSLDSGALVPNAVFNYTVASGDIGSIEGGATVLSADCAGPDPCTGTVEATAGSAVCATDVTVYPTIAEGFRVTLFDTQSGEPVSGATVALQLDGSTLVEATTGAAGDASFTDADIGGATVTAVSAFPANHQWQTVLNPTNNDVTFQTVAVPDPSQSAGVKGEFDFSQVSTQGDIKLGLAGLSIRSSLVDTDFTLLLGEIADYEINLEGVTNGPELVPLPSGLVIELGDTQIKPNFVAQGDPGQRILWALGGQVRLADIGPIISSVTASDDINFGSVLSAVLPFFAKFDHAVVTGDQLDLELQAKPTPPAEGEPIDYSAWPFEELDPVTLDTLLSQNTTYDVPTLPCASGAFDGGNCTGNAYATGAILLTGVVVPGQGIVPLGLTAGLDDPDDQDANDLVDGQLDSDGDNAPAKGQAILDYAPPHDGLEGNPYITIAVALDIDALAGGAGLQASTIVNVTDSFDTGTNNFTLDFVQQQGGSYNRTNEEFTLDAAGAADFYRLNMSDGSDAGEWNVYFESDPGGAIDLAALRPASVTEDRTANVDVQAFALGNGWLGGGDQPTFNDLVEFNGTNFDENFVFYMGGWASTACEPSDEDNPTPHCEEVQ